MRLQKSSFITVLPIFALLLVTDAQKCDRMKIGNDYYKRQLMATFDGYPTGLVIDPRNENLFFVLHKKNYSRGIHWLKHGALGIKQVPIGAADEMIGQCIGVDVANNVIYIGTNQGLVTFDPTKDAVATERPIGDDDIRHIFIDKAKNQMYITTGPNHEVFKFINDSYAVRRYDKIPKAYSFVVDPEGNAYYEYVDGKIYFYSSELFEPVQYKGFSKELKYILKLNNQNEAIIAVKGSLFKLTTKNVLPIKIAQLGFKITAMEFDTKNNIIIGTKGKIYRYKPIVGSDACPADDYFMSSI